MSAFVNPWQQQQQQQDGPNVPPGFFGYSLNPENQQKVAAAAQAMPGQPMPTSTESSAQASPQPQPQAGPGMLAPPAPVGPGFLQQNQAGPGLLSLIAQQPQTPNVIPTQQEWAQNNPTLQAHQIGQGKIGKALFLTAAGLAGASGGLHGDPSAGLNYVAGVNQYNNSVPDLNNQRYQQQVIQPQKDQLAAQDQQAQAAERKAKADKEEAAAQSNQPVEVTPEQAANIGNAALAGQQVSQRTLASLLAGKQKADTAGTAQKQNLAVHGLKQQPDGSIVPDEESPVYQRNQVALDLMQSHVALAQAQAELAKSKNDPNSPAYKLATQKLAVARQNASAASTRASAYMGKYMQGAYNVGLDGKTLPGAPIISDDSGSQTVVGSTNAGTAIKGQSNAAQFNDVHGALDSVEKTAGDLVASGGKLNSPAINYAMQHMSGSASEFLQSLDKAGLNPQERAYVQSIASAHENIQALRKSAGGTATDSAVAKLDAMIPNASTPDIDYLRGQTGQIRATAQRLGKGATVAQGGLTVRGQGRNAPPAASTAPPAVQVGQTVTLKDGTKIKVKAVHPDGSFE